ncbi:hypothetical protein [Paraburkholderia hospita]|jgi:hypothetical protein|uniref:Uncharacterized protein n=1 Tax=Paraburkholderia hospita TaxID=169430 RepID=A0AAN1MJC4_9BURK|nr:hypothetical protein [Paraburkholderia hospita]AUT69221.1 hypothetical protein C2L64_13665 [Paraburkholderia hospita]SEI28484.1 hypothetical protein SAMN05192544_113210 [Paraburkholderia hospita]
MFGVKGVSVQSFYSQTPETFKAMQHLVAVMDDLSRPMQLLENLADHIGRTIAAMRSDGIITPQSSAADIHFVLQERFTRFFEAFATRAGAQAAAAVIFNDEVSKGIVETYVLCGVEK